MSGVEGAKEKKLPEEVQEEPNLDPGASEVTSGRRRQKPQPENESSGTTKGDSNSARPEPSAKSDAQGNGRQPGQQSSNTVEACSSSGEQVAGQIRGHSAVIGQSSGNDEACEIRSLDAVRGISCEEAPPRNAQNEDGAKKGQHRKKAPACAHCGKKGGEEGKLRECAGCRSVQYCGRACQTEHWPSHRPGCKAEGAAKKRAVATSKTSRP
eukprot:jgi/Botrbrau1/15450/Bobra.43_2s0074.1